MFVLVAAQLQVAISNLPPYESGQKTLESWASSAIDPNFLVGLRTIVKVEQQTVVLPKLGRAESWLSWASRRCPKHLQVLGASGRPVVLSIKAMLLILALAA